MLRAIHAIAKKTGTSFCFVDSLECMFVDVCVND